LLVATLPGAVSIAAGADGSARRVAVTIDDLPLVGVPEGDADDYRRVTERLLAALGRHGVPAVGFVNESRLVRDGWPEGEDLRDHLQMWLDAGLELGNHTYSHPDLHNIPLQEFEAEVIRGERVTRVLVESHGGRLRYFRHPYLHTGRDTGTRRDLEEFLAARGYRVAPVTVDNSDWIFARAYQKAAERGDTRTMKRVADAYIPYMESKFEFFERNSRDLVGYELPQILLLHANLLNADHFEALAEMIRERGYTFISLEEALEDEAYSLPDTYTGPGGITWLHRWAMTRGVDRSFFRGEPATPDFVKLEAGVTSE
jgi:peptidoglycan/xylan/chitin deacetylase (PgdA/CDA1 family)